MKLSNREKKYQSGDKIVFMRIISFLLLAIAGLSYSREAKASGTMAAELTYVCLGNDEYEFTLTLYKDCKNGVAPVAPLLSIESKSCDKTASLPLASTGNPVEVSGICPAQLPNTTCNNGTLPGVHKYEYKGRYTLQDMCSDWVFSFSECCRSGNITNLFTKNDLYIEATLNNKVASYNSSPVFLNKPVSYACAGQNYSYNHGVFEADGDVLVYTLVEPLEAKSRPVVFRPGFSATAPVQLGSGTTAFDGASGQLTLVPTGQQVSVAAVLVEEYRQGVKVGSVMRDMQILVSSCINQIPLLFNDGGVITHSGGRLVAPNYIEACPGELIQFALEGNDPDGDMLSIQTNISEIIPGASFVMTSTGSNINADFAWTPLAADTGLHTFTMTLTDNACNVAGVQIYSFSIKVSEGTSAGADKYYCAAGGPIKLKAEGGTAFNWTMLDGTPAIGLSCTDCAEPMASPAETTTYVVTSDLTGSCINKDTVTVFLVSDFILDLSPSTRICEVDEAVELYAIPDVGAVELYKYRWTPANTLDNPEASRTMASPVTTTTYQVTVTSPEGCVRKGAVEVEVKNLVKLNMRPEKNIQTCSSVDLDVVLEPVGYALKESFDEEPDASNWSSITGGSMSDVCGSVSNGSAFFLNGMGARVVETKDLDLSAGGLLDFYVKAGYCGQCTCDRPENDEQDENLYLEYSTDGGITWTFLLMMDADVFALKNDFERIQIPLPDDAKTTTTRFRWLQLNHFEDKDVWILDDVAVRAGLSTNYTYAWSPSEGLTNPAIPNPTVLVDTTTTYVMAVTDDETGCIFRDSVRVEFTRDFDVEVLNTITYCEADPDFEVKAGVVNEQLYTFKWMPPEKVSNPAIPNPKVSPENDTEYSVTVTNIVTGCKRLQSILVKVPPLYTVDAGKDTSVCLTDGVEMNARVIPDIPDEYEYLWRPVQGVSDQTLLNPVLKPNVTMEYILFVKNRQTECIKSDTVKVVVYPNYTLETSDTVTLCPGASSIAISAEASPAGNYSYHWYPAPGIIDSTLSVQYVTPQSDTIYYVLAHRENGCWKKDSVEVKIYNDNLQVTVSDDVLINEGESTELYAFGADSYVWKVNDLQVGEGPRYTATPVEKTIYLVVGKDECFADSAHVVVDVTALEFFLPTLFTPNGDGLNDEFAITNFGKRWNLEVYNSWGQLIYHKKQYTNEWKGEGHPDGIYYYYIEDTVKGESIKGWIHLVR
jgi:gliding motility-associated-like protein